MNAVKAERKKALFGMYRVGESPNNYFNNLSFLISKYNIFILSQWFFVKDNRYIGFSEAEQ